MNRRLLFGIAALAAVAIAVLVVELGSGTKASSDPFQPLEMPGSSSVLDKISRDPLTNPQSQHEGAVEPTLARFGKTLVVTYQVARQREGGAAALIGFATSHDGGRTWTSGFLPGLTVRSQPVGRYRSATDPSVAYDARHRKWLAVSYVIAADTLPFQTLLVSRSRDGVHWAMPRTVLNERISIDKPWVTCDNGTSSPGYGTCYTAYNEQDEGIAVQSTSDGGKSWSKPVVAGRTDLAGAIPLVRSDGTLGVVFRRPGQIAVTWSDDGGKSFSTPAAIGPERLTGDEESGGDPYPLRAPAIPSVAADSAGTIYVAWPECGSTSGCASTDILISSSRNGEVWSRPVEAVTTASGEFALLPAVAADPAPRVPPGRLALVYYLLRPSARTLAPMLARSDDAGRTWTGTSLAQPMPLGSLARAGSIPFVGDYVGVTLERGSVVAALTVAKEPSGHRLRQGIYVARSR
ncbi:MAG TPA: sialidase family protein [Gaiellaceae bacterium]|nr:sialidase family protein [Gaiellaceae bacterium]